MTLNDLYPQFQGHAITDIVWNTNRDLHASYSTVSFRMILSDLAKYPMTRSVARSLCDSWAFSVFVRWCSSSFSFYPSCPNTSWLDRCSVQLIFISLLQIHISNDSSFWISTFLNVYVSAAYNTVLQNPNQTSFFYSNFMFPLSNSRRLLNASFPTAIPRFTSLW